MQDATKGVLVIDDHPIVGRGLRALVEHKTGVRGCRKADARLLDRLAEVARASEIRRHDRLTERQDKIARMVAEGLSNKQIARELSISPATVKNHVHAILGKFDLPRRSAIGSQLTGVNSVYERA